MAPRPADEQCPRCGRAFQCQPQNVAECQCAAVPMTPAELDHVRERWAGCLCADCLRAIKQQMQAQQ